MNSHRAFSSPLFFTVLLFYFCLQLAVAQTSPFWTTYQHDSRHSGLSPFVGPSTDTVQWTFDLVDASAPYPVVGPTGLIYLAFESPVNGHTWKVLAVNPDGTIAFQTATYPGRAGSTPTIADDGTIYVGTRTSSGTDHDLYAFFPDGSFKWKISLPGFGQSVTLGPDGTVYVPSGQGFPTQCKLLALNPADGSSKWTADCMGRQGFNAVAIAPGGNIIATGTTDGFWPFVAAHRSTDGTLLWSLTYPTLPAPASTSPPAVASDGTIYFWASSPSRLWAASATGQLLWSSQTLADFGAASTPALAPDGSILIATAAQTLPDRPARLFSFNPSGQLNWSRDLAFDNRLTSGTPQIAIDASGTAYGSLNPNGLSCPSWPCPTTPVLFAVDNNSSLLWSHSALLANTNVMGSAGTLYAVLLDNAPAPANAVWRLYSFSSPGAPPPSISSVSPSSGYQGQTITNFTVNGSHFQATSTVSFSGTGITVNSYSTRTATQIVASITIALDAPTGARDVFVTNPDGQQAARGAGFTVLQTTPSVHVISISGISPTSAQQGDYVADFQVDGRNFDRSAVLSFSGGGITVQYTTQHRNKIVADLNIAHDAALGSRNVIVTNPNGTAAMLPGAFSVLEGKDLRELLRDITPEQIIDPNGDLTISEGNLWITIRDFANSVEKNKGEEYEGCDFAAIRVTQSISGKKIAQPFSALFSILSGGLDGTTGSFWGDILLSFGVHLLTESGSSEGLGPNTMKFVIRESAAYVLPRVFGNYLHGVSGLLMLQEFENFLKKQEGLTPVEGSGDSTSFLPTTAKLKVFYSPLTHYASGSVHAVCQGTARDYVIRYVVKKGLFDKGVFDPQKPYSFDRVPVE